MPSERQVIEVEETLQRAEVNFNLTREREQKAGGGSSEPFQSSPVHRRKILAKSLFHVPNVFPSSCYGVPGSNFPTECMAYNLIGIAYR